LAFGALELLFLHNTQEIGSFKVISVFHAEARIHVLLRENANGEGVVATFEAALEFQVHGFRVVVAEDDILGFDVFDVFLLLLALLDVAVQFAILGNRVSPEFTAATGFLADFELDAFLLFVLG